MLKIELNFKGEMGFGNEEVMSEVLCRVRITLAI